MKKYTDKELAILWEQLGNVPFDEEYDELFLAEDWLHFKKGTPREDIWHWFDDAHSIGLYILMGVTKGKRYV